MIRQEKIMDIYSLHREGFRIDAIAKRTGLNWRTVKKYMENNFERKQYCNLNNSHHL